MPTLVLHYPCAKRKQGQFRNFKELQAEGNADDGYAPKCTNQQVRQCHFNAKEDYPNDIDNQGWNPSSILDFSSEREE